MEQIGSKTKVTNPSTSEDCGLNVVKKRSRISNHVRPPQVVVNKPAFISLSRKREENVRTYSRKPKNSEIVNKVSATPKVVFASNTSTASNLTTNMEYTSNFEDGIQDESIQCTEIEVKLERIESHDPLLITEETVIENIKDEVVHEEYNQTNNGTTPNDNSINNVPAVNHELKQKAEEVIKLICSRRYDDDTLNLVGEQLDQILEVFKVAKQRSLIANFLKSKR